MDAPRRGRRPRRPASFLFHASGGDIPHPDGRTRRGRRPRRPAHVSSMSPTGRVPRSRARVTFGCSGPLIFLFYASGGHISFNSERNMEKNAAKNRWFLDFLPSDCSRPTKRPTSNRPCSHPRCRSRVPQCSAASYRRGAMLRPLLYTAMYHDLKLSAAQGAAPTLAANGGKCAI